MLVGLETTWRTCLFPDHQVIRVTRSISQQCYCSTPILGHSSAPCSRPMLTIRVPPLYSMHSPPRISRRVTRHRRLTSQSSFYKSIDYPNYPPSDPNLELHSAAASGNVGLVHYALTHGQPVNSVLHGVLPLHAACSGGSVSVVRMLIERGADVNAPRLPRRYSDNKKSTAPSVGAAGASYSA